MSLFIMNEKSIRIARKLVDGEVTFEDSDFILVNISGETIIRNNSDYLSRAYDPLKSRKHFWQKNFGMEPLPVEYPNAAKAFAGILGKELDLTSSDMQDAIDQADQA